MRKCAPSQGRPSGKHKLAGVAAAGDEKCASAATSATSESGEAAP